MRHKSTVSKIKSSEDLSLSFHTIPIEKLQFTKRLDDLSDEAFYEVFEGTYACEEVMILSMDATTHFRQKLALSNDTLFPEIEIMKMLPSHSNIAKPIGVCYENDFTAHLVIEKFGDMTLENYIRLYKKSLSARSIISLCRKVAKAMMHLHDHSIIHSDIGSCNILIDIRKKDIKLFKFALCRKSTNMYTPPQLGPIKSMAPEQILQNTITRKSDIWQFGVLMFEAILGNEPFASLTNEEAYDIITMENFVFSPPKYTPPLISHIIKSCTATIPSKRPSFEEIVKILSMPRINE